MKGQKGFLPLLTTLLLVATILTSCLSPSTKIVITETPTAKIPKTAAVAPPSLEEKVGYQDDFSNPESGWWLTSNDVTFSKGYEAGLFHIAAVKGGYIGISLFQVKPFSDFTLEIDAFLKQAGALYGVVARFTREKGYYLFLVGIDGKYSVIKFDMSKTGNDRFMTLKEGSSAAIKKGLGQVNKLSVTCSGSSLSFAANGASLTTVEDSAFPIGEIGLATRVFGDGAGSKADFDNFKISTLTPPAVQPTQKAVEVASQLVLPSSLNQVSLETVSSKDGKVQKHVCSFPKQEVAPKLFLFKSITLAPTSTSSYQGEIALKFEYTGSETDLTFRHREVIPKSFAQDWKDIKASYPNGVSVEVIEADPVVEIIITATGYILYTVLGGLVIILTVPAVASTPRMSIETINEYSNAWKTNRGQKLVKWMDERLKKYCDQIRKSADRHGIPPRLLATLLLNELAVYGLEDQWQEIIPDTGSIGIAQLEVKRALDHGLVDVTDEDVSNAILKYKLSQAEKDIDKSYDKAAKLVIWEKLNDPLFAVEAAAREARRLIKMFEKGSPYLKNPWAMALLVNPEEGIDPKNPYTNLKVSDPKEKDPEKIRIMKEETLALLVAAPYNNTGALIKSDDPELAKVLKRPEDPWLPRKVGPFSQGRVHGANAADYFSEALIYEWCFKKTTTPSKEREDVPLLPPENKGKVTYVGTFVNPPSAAGESNEVTLTLDTNTGDISFEAKLSVGECVFVYTVTGEDAYIYDPVSRDISGLVDYTDCGGRKSATWFYVDVSEDGTTASGYTGVYDFRMTLKEE